MNSLLAKKIEAGDFIITAEYLPGTDMSTIPVDQLKRSGAMAINVIRMAPLFQAWPRRSNCNRQILNLYCK